MKPRLTIGNLNFSSWSLRAWLTLRWAGIDFNETLIDLNQPGYGESTIGEVLAASPSGKVPALAIGSETGSQTDYETIWDTLGIAQWAIDNGGRDALLPMDAERRNRLWSVVGEMHAGFGAVRRDLSMNIRRRCTAHGLPPDTRADIARVDALWRDCRERFGQTGGFLLGERSLADAFFLPVATRFRTYGVALSQESEAYVAHVLQDPAFLEWEARVKAEPVRPFGRAVIDGLFPDQPERYDE
ncbi:MAG: glutathione S-transferase [Betaproteobacteria bacterium]|nr:glutathione S-transferase [Betaproteobacteria bacterium]